MPYIGRGTDKLSNVEVLDNITFDGSSSYTLQKGGSNFTPSSANTLLVSIDGVVQAGNFTVSGSTIDFGTAVAGTSTCDFILHYGIGLITAPSDGTVTTAKLADSSVSLAKLTATGTKDATTFLRGDNTFAEAGGGVIQMTTSSSTTSVSTSNTSYADTTFTVAITPTSTSNKILIITQGAIEVSNGRGFLTLNRSGYGDLHGDLGASSLADYEGSTGRNGYVTFMYLDSPSSTSAITYKVKYRISNASYVVNYGAVGGTVQQMFAIELDGGIF